MAAWCARFCKLPRRTQKSTEQKPAKQKEGDVRFVVNGKVKPRLLNDLYSAVEWNTQGERTHAKTKAMLQTSPCYVAAWVGTRLVGFGRISADPYKAQVLDVMTHPECWKRGIASGIMTRLLDYARDRFLGVTLIAAGGLEPFYTRFGFEVADAKSDVLMFLSEEPQDTSPATPIDASWYERPEGISERLAAGGVVVRVEGERLKVALVVEAGLGHAILPKGGLEKGESVLKAAEREIAEEGGLSGLTMVLKLGVRERLSYRKKRWSVTHYFLFSTTQIEGTPTDEGRNYGLEWHDLDNLPPMLWPEQRALIETNKETIRMFLAP